MIIEGSFALDTPDPTEKELQLHSLKSESRRPSMNLTLRQLCYKLENVTLSLVLAERLGSNNKANTIVNLTAIPNQ